MDAPFWGCFSRVDRKDLVANGRNFGARKLQYTARHIKVFVIRTVLFSLIIGPPSQSALRLAVIAVKLIAIDRNKKYHAIFSKIPKQS